MLLYLARDSQVMDLGIHYLQVCRDNVGTLHTSLDEAKRKLSIALLHEARTSNNGLIELSIIWDEPKKAHCVVRSFDANGNNGIWMEVAIGRIKEMKVS